MTRLDVTPEIIALAEELGVDTSAPIEAIRRYCRKRIDDWVVESGGVRTIDDLERVVTNRLRMVFEEIRTDADFDRLTDVYARGKKDFVFAAMRTKFDDSDNPTYGALVERKTVAPDAPDHFVAVIDCRGNKLARRFFTRWHEISHRLTTHADLPEPVFRSEHDPIERLMDDIAGQIGFYEPIFVPAFTHASRGKSHLSFGTVETVVREAFPAASFQSTMFACMRQLPSPLIYLEAAIGHKKGMDAGPGELRAIKVIPNKPAKDSGFTIPTNVRVPSTSVLHRLFAAEPLKDDVSSENLNQWEAGGRNLNDVDVIVEGRRVPERVIAIVQPER